MPRHQTTAEAKAAQAANAAAREETLAFTFLRQLKQLQSDTHLYGRPGTHVRKALQAELDWLIEESEAYRNAAAELFVAGSTPEYASAAEAVSAANTVWKKVSSDD